MRLIMSDVHAGYGAIGVLRGVSLEVPANGFVALIGSNGAGKSTLVKAAVGAIPVTSGSVWLGERDVTSWQTFAVVRCGVGYVPEGRMLLSPLSVLDNLTLSSFARRTRRAERSQRLERVFSLFPRLRDRRLQIAGSLSGGEQQMVAIGRALMADPSILVLDEPTMGLAPAIVADLADVLREIHLTGVGVLLVEQNAAFALELATDVHVVDQGQIAATGTPAEMRHHLISGLRPNG